jgi:hypothetical protein
MDSSDDFDSMLRHMMAELTEQFAHPLAIETTITHVTTAAVELIPDVAHADVLQIFGEDQFESIGATSQTATEVSDAQKRTGQGPCLEAASHDCIIRCADLHQESRWPAFCEAATASGIAGLMSFQLYTHDTRKAALNLYGGTPFGFGPDDEAIGAMLATQAANAFIAYDKELQFRSALVSRDIIGQAKGMLMQRFDIDAVLAFEVLTVLSQKNNTPIAEVATDMVTRRLLRNND